MSKNNKKIKDRKIRHKFSKKIPNDTPSPTKKCARPTLRRHWFGTAVAPGHQPRVLS